MPRLPSAQRDKCWTVATNVCHARGSATSTVSPRLTPVFFRDPSRPLPLSRHLLIPTPPHERRTEPRVRGTEPRVRGPWPQVMTPTQAGNSHCTAQRQSGTEVPSAPLPRPFPIIPYTVATPAAGTPFLFVLVPAGDCSLKRCQYPRSCGMAVRRQPRSHPWPSVHMDALVTGPRFARASGERSCDSGGLPRFCF